MLDPDFSNGAAGLDTGNVCAMLAMLECIHSEASDDVVMAEFAGTVGCAIVQLRELQHLAYETMLEIEAERASGSKGRHLRLAHRKPS